MQKGTLSDKIAILKVFCSYFLFAFFIYSHAIDSPSILQLWPLKALSDFFKYIFVETQTEPEIACGVPVHNLTINGFWHFTGRRWEVTELGVYMQFYCVCDTSIFAKLQF